MHATRPRSPRRGFTLIELLVVIAIIGLISAVALPVVLPALNERRVSEAARQLQAILAGARDAAIRANAPRGIRLLPDPVFDGIGTPSTGGGPAAVHALASNRVVPIEAAPDYSEGVVLLVPPGTASTPTSLGSYPYPSNPSLNLLVLYEVPSINVGTVASPVNIPNNPTSWYWNIRQGDKIRFNNAGPYYTIAGPMKIGPHPDPNAATNKTYQNPERFINNGPPATIPSNPINRAPEFLILVNGMDDNGDGFVDEAFDGLDNDGDLRVDPSFNGLDDDGNGFTDDEFVTTEYEVETIDASLAAPFANLATLSYTITRRPVVSPGARELTLPAGTVVDLTGWNAPSVALAAGLNTGQVFPPERSRVPVDPYTFYVDVLISPSGQVLQGGPGGSNGDFNPASPAGSQPFYHFWITEREGVVPPLWGVNDTFANKSGDSKLFIPNPNPSYANGITNLLPMPKNTPNYADTAHPYLAGERRLVTLFLKTGQVVTNSIEVLDGLDVNTPYYDAQAGVKESQ